MNVEERQCALKLIRDESGKAYYTGRVDGQWGAQSKSALCRMAQDTGTDGSDHSIWQTLRGRALTALNEGENNGGTDCTAAGNGSFWDEIRYFKRSEFACPCGRCGGFPVEPNETMVRMCDNIRRKAGRPMTITSGVRCQVHNDELPGSVPNSLHVQGRAADFVITGVPQSRCLQLANEEQNKNYAYAISGGSAVHVDTKK